MTEKIVFALKVTLSPEEQARFRRAPTTNLEAYGYYLRGWEVYYSQFTKAANRQARQWFEQAIAVDPRYAAAYARVSFTHWIEWAWQWSEDPSSTLDRAYTFARQAIALDPSLSHAHTVLGWVLLFKKQYDQALSELEAAIALNPNDAEAYARLGATLLFVGRAEEAVGRLEQAIRLDPHYPPLYVSLLGAAYFRTGQLLQAETALQQGIMRNPNLHPARLWLTVVYGETGREAEARAEAAEVLRRSPEFSLEAIRQTFAFKDPQGLERILAVLRNAGLK